MCVNYIEPRSARGSLSCIGGHKALCGAQSEYAWHSVVYLRDNGDSERCKECLVLLALER